MKKGDKDPTRQAQSPSAPVCPKASRPTTSISNGRSRCWRCRATSASHPEDGEPIIAGVGRFGPYVKHGKTYANLEEGDDVLTVGLNRAVTLIAEKNANPGKGRRSAPIPARRWASIPTRAA